MAQCDINNSFMTGSGGIQFPRSINIYIYASTTWLISMWVDVVKFVCFGSRGGGGRGGEGKNASSSHHRAGIAMSAAGRN